MTANANQKQRSTLSMMIYYLRYKPLLVTINTILWLLIHLLPVFIGLFIKGLFDALSGEGAATQSAWTFLILIVALDASRMGILGLGIWVWARYYLETVLLLRRNMLSYLLRAPGSRRMADSPSEAISRFRDDVDDIAGYVENWTDFWGMFAHAIFAFVIMARIDALMTVLICVPLVLSLAVTQLMRPQIRKTRRRMREATGRVTDFIGETFNAVQAVKVAGSEASVLGQFEKLNATRRQAALKDSFLTEVFRSVTDNMVSIGIGIILLLAATRLRDGTFSVGDFALFVSYMPRLTGIMSFMGSMFVQHKRAGVSFERIAKLLHDAPQTTPIDVAGLCLLGDMPAFVEERPEIKPLETLEVKNLSYIHPDGEVAFENVSLTMTRGSFTVVTGRIGSGKSIFVRVMLGLLPKSSGEIYWNGEHVEDAASFFVPPRSAYTSQVPRLFSDTLRENVLMGSDDADLDRAIKMAVLSPDLRQLERGLDTLVGTRGVKLSGGQVQRSSAARMFMRNADLLVFDDLSSALDVETEQKLWDGIFEQGQATCLVVSHRRAALQSADHILVLKNGQVEAEGSLEGLLETSEEMQHLWRGEEAVKD
jgi:ATP-binding cassette, subfamily B, bacterial